MHSALPWLTVGEVVEQLGQLGVGAVLVRDENGVIRGIVSERDVVRALGRHGDELLPMPVTEIMTRTWRPARRRDGRPGRWPG